MRTMAIEIEGIPQKGKYANDDETNETTMAESNALVGVGRELGLHELFFEASCKHLGFGHYFEYAVLKSNCPITVENLKAALEVLVNFQPFLRMTVVEKIEKDRPPTYKASFEEPHTRLYYQPCEVDYTKVIRTRTRKSDDDLAEIVREEEIFLSREERYGDGPRWRVVFNIPEDKEGQSGEQNATYKYDLFFEMNHEFVDGVSGYDLVYRQLLPILNKVINDLPVDEIFLQPVEVTPPYEEEFVGCFHSADERPPWYAKAGMTLLRKFNKAFKSNRLGQHIIASEGSPFLEEKGTGIFTYCFEESLLQRILHERITFGVSVHSILLTAFSFAMARLLQEIGTTVPKEIKSFWPIDSRKKLEKYKSPQPLGYFSAASGTTSMKLPTPYRLNREVFWDKAKNIARQVSKGVRNTNEKAGLGFLAYMAEHLQSGNFIQMSNEINIVSHFCLSNLGKCCPGPEPDGTLEKVVDAPEIYFGMHGKGSSDLWFPFFITVVNHQGKLFIASSYDKQWVKREIPEKLLQFAEDTLDQVCEKNGGKQG